MKIGFIGLGRMGRPIVQRLLASGAEVVVTDVDATVLDWASGTGARAAPSPADLARDADFVLSCVPGPTEVGEVMSGRDGVIHAARPGMVVIEMSTIGFAQGRLLGQAFRDKGAMFLDSPLSGGELAAAEGRLTAMIGGTEEALQLASPILDTFCTQIFHMGGTGAGYIAKAINQAIYISYIASFCEAVSLGRSAGLSAPTLVSAIKSSVGGSPFMTGWDSRLLSGDTQSGFLIRRVLKDLHVAQEAASALGVEAPILEAVANAFRSHDAAGHGELDITAAFHEPL